MAVAPAVARRPAGDSPEAEDEDAHDNGDREEWRNFGGRENKGEEEEQDGQTKHGHPHGPDTGRTFSRT